MDSKRQYAYTPRKMNEALQLLGERIRKLRLKHGWSQEKLAERCGLSPGAVGAIELGQRKCRISSIWVIAYHLGTTAPKLLKDLDSIVIVGMHGMQDN